ncbi:MAG TPA: transposase [Burkholderiaceae bacterium]
MARLPRLVLPGHPHLVLQRGREGAHVFADDEDRRRYLEALRQATRDSGVALHGYVLMDDHVHLLATPVSEQSLSRAMQRVGRRYVSAFRARHGGSGALFEGRFRAAPIEAEAFLLDCLRHLEQNPVRHGLVAAPEDYRWSSAAHHAGRRRDPLLTEHPMFWRLGNTPFEREAAWRAIGHAALPPARARAIREACAKGWALGGEAFLASAKRLTARRLAPLPRGRRASAGSNDSVPIRKASSNRSDLL